MSCLALVFQLIIAIVGNKSEMYVTWKDKFDAHLNVHFKLNLKREATSKLYLTAEDERKY